MSERNLGAFPPVEGPLRGSPAADGAAPGVAPGNAMERSGASAPGESAAGGATSPASAGGDAPDLQPPPWAPSPFAAGEALDAPLVDPFRGQPGEAARLEEGEGPDPPPRRRLWLAAGLFLLTVVSVLDVGRAPDAGPGVLRGLLSGWVFAVPLLAILLCHEFAHFIAARVHGVPASLPLFIPLPRLSPFGTLGAIIVMQGRIKSARALLDIGASGPLAGMAVALPLMVWGLRLSEVKPNVETGYVQEGKSLLYWLLQRLVVGDIPPGHDVWLHPLAFAAWVGFFVTFMNLLPFGQLDGGHVAYALLGGDRQDRAARWVAWVPLVMVPITLVAYGLPVLRSTLTRGWEATVATPLGAPVFWLMWFGLLRVMRRFSDENHPPVDDATLGPGRRAVGWVTLSLFVLLFLPAPLVAY